MPESKTPIGFVFSVMRSWFPRISGINRGRSGRALSGAGGWLLEEAGGAGFDFTTVVFFAAL